MRKQPPLLPAETLRRVLRVAQANGTSVLLVAGIVALLAAASQAPLDTGIGLLVSLAGAMELHGAAQLHRADGRGIKWLCLSQVLLLAVVLGYIGFRLRHPDLAALDRMVNDDWLRLNAAAAHLPVGEYKQQLYSLFYLLAGVGTLGYQGTMLWYYGSRSQTLRSALTLQ